MDVFKIGRLPIVGVLTLSASLFGCGINGLTVENPSTSQPTTQQKPVTPLQMDVILAANDTNGHPMTFTSVHWFWSQQTSPVQQLSNGFRFTSQTDPDWTSIEVSAFFNGLESCPIGITSSILIYGDGTSPDDQRVLSLETTAFSQTAGQIITNDFNSTVTTPQTVEACGTTFTVQFQITEISH